jgi:hypothetical protein
MYEFRSIINSSSSSSSSSTSSSNSVVMAVLLVANEGFIMIECRNICEETVHCKTSYADLLNGNAYELNNIL